MTPDRQSREPAATALPRETAAIAAWRIPPNALAMGLLAAAVAAGAWLRFAAIGGREMSPDEGASWAAAAAPNLGEVMRSQAVLNPGKLALYEIALHGWMRLFGDGLAAMRALSAMLDTLGIVVLFILVRELLAGPDDREAQPLASHRHVALVGLPFAEAQMVAALAALLLAVNLVTIKYARELRMYPLALLIVLLQVWVFVRAVRRGGGFDLASLAVLTALAMGAHFSAAFMLVAEALCLPALPRMQSRRERPQRMPPPLAIAAALGAGAALFVLLALPALRTGASAFAYGATSWIERPPWWEPAALFNKATGTFAFPLITVFWGWGVWRGWRRAPSQVAFALVWMWVPPVLMLIASYAFSPMLVERYVLWCFVPFFMLAAFGVWELRAVRARAGAIGLMVVLALGHLHAYRRRPHDSQWREAARAAATAVAPGGTIAVAPPYAVNVVRYYLRHTKAAGDAVAADDSGAAVLLIGDQWKAPDKAARLLAKYPQALAGFRGVRMQGRGTRAK